MKNIQLKLWFDEKYVRRESAILSPLVGSQYTNGIVCRVTTEVSSVALAVEQFDDQNKVSFRLKI